MPLASPPRSRRRKVYPPRTWIWVLTFWVLLLLLCFVLAWPPSIVAYYRQKIYSDLWPLQRRLIDFIRFHWILGPRDSIFHLWNFTLRSWNFATMQLHNAILSPLITQLRVVWTVLPSTAKLKEELLEFITCLLRHKWPGLVFPRASTWIAWKEQWRIDVHTIKALIWGWLNGSRDV